MNKSKDPLNCSAHGFIFSHGVCIPELSCVHFTKIPRTNQCDFVMTTDDCQDDEAFIHYMELFACQYNEWEGEIYIGLLIVITEVLLLFLVLGTTADNFFSPSLCAISNSLGMSENLAGVTLLAFGNAAPDIFTSLAGATILGPEIVECQLLGGGIFVTSIVASAILMTKSFYANPSAFVRDTIFFMIAIGWTRFITNGAFLVLGRTIFLIALYIIYVVVVIIDTWYQRRKNQHIAQRVSVLVNNERKSAFRAETDRTSKTEINLRKSFALSRAPSPMFVNSQVTLPPSVRPTRRAVSRMTPISGLVMGAERLNILKTAGLSDVVTQERDGNFSSIGVSLDGDFIFRKNESLWDDFLNEVIPIDDEDWASSKVAGKIFILMKAPIIYVFKYIIPVVDQGAMNNGWCKLLNCLHILIAPMFMCWSLGVFSNGMLIALSVGLSVFVVSLGFMIAVFTTTEVSRPPRYHIVFGVMGFVTAINMIYSVSHELVSLLNVIGFLCDISIATLAMTILAYGNSVGDMVANIALAKAGYPRMAWAGCFGSPLLSALLGNGISLTFLVETKGVNHYYSFETRYSGLITNCFFFLFLSLLSSLVIIPMINFQCRISYATFLLFIYAMFLSFSLMCEWNVIHPLGL